MEEEKTRENTFTITIARNSDGEILRVIQGRSIFAGVAGNLGASDSVSICLNEAASGLDALAAAFAAERAVNEFEKEDKKFALVRTIFNLKNLKDLALDKVEEDEGEGE